MKRNLNLILVLIFLSAGLFLAALFVDKTREVRRKAEETPVLAQLKVLQKNSQGISLSAEITSFEGKALSTFDLFVAYNTADLITDVNQVAAGSGITINDVRLVDSDVKGIRVIGAVKSPASLEAKEVVTLKFVLADGHQGKTTVDLTANLAYCFLSDCENTASLVQSTYSLPIQLGEIAPTVTPTPTISPNGARISFDPDTGDFGKDEDFVVSVNGEVGSNIKITAAEVSLKIPNSLELVKIEASSDDFEVHRLAQADNRAVSLVADYSSLSWPTGLNELFKLTLKGKAVGTANLTGDVVLVGDKNGSGWSFDQKITGAYTISEAASNPVLNFKIKFDLVDYKIDDQLVRVKVSNGNDNWLFEDVKVVSDNQGKLTGRVNLVGVPAGSGYTILIKGPKHLAIKFCENGQTSRCSQNQSLTLQNGINNFDFSNLALSAGDIPDENGIQDGVVDVMDLSQRLKPALTSNDQKLRERANLDFNKDENNRPIINGRDILLYLRTLSARYDDEL